MYEKCQLCATDVVKTVEVEVLDFDGPTSKSAHVCKPCFGRFDPDVWIARQFWDATKPRVRFEKLPRFR